MSSIQVALPTSTAIMNITNPQTLRTYSNFIHKLISDGITEIPEIGAVKLMLDCGASTASTATRMVKTLYNRRVLDWSAQPEDRTYITQPMDIMHRIAGAFDEQLSKLSELTWSKSERPAKEKHRNWLINLVNTYMNPRNIMELPGISCECTHKFKDIWPDANIHGAEYNENTFEEISAKGLHSMLYHGDIGEFFRDRSYKTTYDFIHLDFCGPFGNPTAQVIKNALASNKIRNGSIVAITLLNGRVRDDTTLLREAGAFANDEMRSRLDIINAFPLWFMSIAHRRSLMSARLIGFDRYQDTSPMVVYIFKLTKHDSVISQWSAGIKNAYEAVERKYENDPKSIKSSSNRNFRQSSNGSEVA